MAINPWLTFLPVVGSTNDEVRDRLEGYLAAVEAVPTGPKTGPREPAMAETGTSSREIERGN